MVSAEAFVDIFWTDCSVASLEILPFLINIKLLTKITGISARNRGHDSNKSEFETLKLTGDQVGTCEG